LPNTLSAKFTVFFWSIFFIINLGIYLFATGYLKDILLSSEREKVELLVNTLEPVLAINLSFEQTAELEQLLETIYKVPNITEVSLVSQNYKKELLGKQDTSRQRSYKTSLHDPLTKRKIATLTLHYSNKNLLLVERKIKIAMFSAFAFALLLFLFFYLLIKKELNILNYISSTLERYSQDKKIKIIEVKNTTSEIKTIANVANTMMQNISSNLTELQSFNQRLENEVYTQVAKLQNQEKMMIHQSRQAAMGEMLESIAHQWRQPLNIIGLASSNLELENSLGIHNQENFQEKMTIISDNINYMSSTIDDFRDFLNPNREQQLFNPSDVIEEVLKILKAQLSNNKITLTIDRDDTIEFYGVENEFKQVLFVLINNSKDAIKSQQEQGLLTEGKIHISIYAKNNSISLCDNGGGIPKDIINSIFDPYFTTKFASSGTGIGLYIAKNIITSRMQGELHVKNTDEGCCFTILQSHKNLQE